MTASDSFQGLEIASHAFLLAEDMNRRQPCAQCGRSSKHYCSHCALLVGGPAAEERFPKVKLPVPITILRHERELDSKSTSVHAKLLAPNDVTICLFPANIPKFNDPSRVLLLFPGPTSRLIEDIPRDSFDQLVVIDGTWSQAKAINRHEGLNGCTRVTIHPRVTMFWRYQALSPNYLATIEAIYYLYREYAEAFGDPNFTSQNILLPSSSSQPTSMSSSPLSSNSFEKKRYRYNGQYDNLLFFYRFQYEMIQSFYAKDPNRKYTKKHRPDYIKYSQTTSSEESQNNLAAESKDEHEGQDEIENEDSHSRNRKRAACDDDDSDSMYADEDNDSHASGKKSRPAEVTQHP